MLCALRFYATSANGLVSVVGWGPAGPRFRKRLRGGTARSLCVPCCGVSIDFSRILQFWHRLLRWAVWTFRHLSRRDVDGHFFAPVSTFPRARFLPDDFVSKLLFGRRLIAVFVCALESVRECVRTPFALLPLLLGDCGKTRARWTAASGCWLLLLEPRSRDVENCVVYPRHLRRRCGTGAGTATSSQTSLSAAARKAATTAKLLVRRQSNNSGGR